MRAFARFKGEIWCMDLTYVDKLVKDSNGVKYSPVRQNLFDRTVDAKGMKTKNSKETVKTLSKLINKKLDQRKLGWIRGQNLLGSSKNFAALME